MLSRVARWLLIGLAVVGIAATIIPAIPGNMWWVRYFDFPRIQILLASAAVWLLLLLVSQGRVSRLALFALAGVIAWQAYVLHPYTALAPPNQIATETCAPGNRLRLLTVNLRMTTEHDNRLLNMVRQVDPDIAWLQEVDEWWLRHLAPLAATMPHSITQAQPNYFGAALFSRYPLIDPEVRFLTGSREPSVFTGVRLPSDQPIRLYALHPPPPLPGQSTAERDAQILATALAAHDDNLPHVVAGDLNAVPWEDTIDLAKRVGRLLDPRIGRGFYITWNAENPVLKWPLDHILPGQNFTLTGLRVLPEFGSDHRPYLAELCFNPAAAVWQSPPPMWPGDLEEARTAVLRGQGTADQAAVAPPPVKFPAPADGPAPAVPADAATPAGEISPVRP
ncbi:MAG: endonuclease/exonuclease/phosphatase family protein [Alphaproteobacteria bacterium]